MVLNTTEIAEWNEWAFSNSNKLEIACPFITSFGLGLFREALKRHCKITLVTRLDPFSVALGSLDAKQIASIIKDFPKSFIVYDNKYLHAKVLIDRKSKCAILGSANLTKGGLQRNFELGFHLKGKNYELACSNFEGLKEKSIIVTEADLLYVCEVAESKLKSIAELSKSINNSIVAFPSHEKTYPEVIRAILTKLRSKLKSSQEGLRVADFDKYLKSSRKEQGEDSFTLVRRRHFLERLGIIEIAKDTVRIGKNALLISKSNTKQFSDRLREAFPEFDEFLIQLKSKPTAKKPYWTLGDFERHLKETGASDGLINQLDNIKRWCAHLDLIDIDGTMKNIKGFRIKSKRKAKVNSK